MANLRTWFLLVVILGAGWMKPNLSEQRNGFQEPGSNRVADVLVPPTNDANLQNVKVDDYRLDPRQSSIVFAISHFKLSYLYGRFNKLSGSFQFAKENLSDSKFRFEIDADSIDTNLKERDDHLKSDEFFDAKKYPKIVFESSEIVPTKAGFMMKGQMTILETTNFVEIPARVVGVGKGPFGQERAGFFARFTIKRSEFGMKKMLPDIGDSIAITFSFEGIKK